MTPTKPPTWQILLAFAIIYLVWGSTFLAIRIGVHDVPPFLLAGIRFIAAGALLFGWTLIRGEASPSARQWGSIAILAILVFVIDYGLVFWAEQRVPSGITAVMMATIPAFTALSEIIILRTQRLTLRLSAALIIGIFGVFVLTSRALNIGDISIDFTGAVALIIGAIGWSVASALTLKLPLPSSKVVNSAAQMLVGGIFLTITSAALGEFPRFHPAEVPTAAWLALAYMAIVGSIIAFTAYIWLLHHESPTKVGTYAYVNPVVAVILGYFLADEPLGPRTLLGTLCVLISVIMITLSRK